MTTVEQIAALAAQQQSLPADHSGPYQDHEKRERLRSITDRIAALYGQKNQEAADRRTALSDRARR